MTRIADEAEDLAQLWGTRAGFVVNSVRRDRTGWDHLFEMSLPREPGSSDPFGLPTCAFTCRVQVKAVTGDRRGVSIKLTNWKRAIEDPLPWFFLLVRFENDEVREAALIHMGQQIVDRVVARLCALPDSAKQQLHRQTLAVGWRDGTILEQPIERSLIQAIAEVVGNDALEYAKIKQTWYENAGYSDRSELLVKMGLGPFEPDELCRRLARAAVGLDNIESSQVSLARHRFGREEPLRIKGPIGASMKWGESTAREIMLNIQDSSGLHLITLPVSGPYSVIWVRPIQEFYLAQTGSLNSAAQHA